MKTGLTALLAITVSACATIAPSNHSTTPIEQDGGAEAAAPDQVALTDPAIVDSFIESLVEDGRVVGYSVLVYQHGRETYYGAAGFADRENNEPLQRDTIHSIYSMTKPIIGVALMQLYEQDKFELDDPIALYLPEFADATVFAGTDEAGKVVLEAPNKTMTVLDMLRHTAGLAQSKWDGPEALTQIYQAAPEFSLENTLSEMAEASGNVPLLYHPGTQWRYSPAVSMQALMVERLSGKPINEYLKEEIFDPLGMSDTSYFVPEEKQHRLATIYSMNDEGQLDISTDDFTYNLHRKPHVMKPGGFGLASTIDDYGRFARMLLNGGALDGVRILKPATVSLMSEDHLPSTVSDTHFLLDGGPQGFGIDFAVRLAPPQSDGELFGYVGEYNWSGAAGTNFWVDPENDLVTVIMTQRLPFEGQIHKEVRDAIYNVMERSAPD